MTAALLTTILAAEVESALRRPRFSWRHALAGAAGAATLACTTTDVVLPGRGVGLDQWDGTYAGRWIGVDQDLTDSGSLRFVVVNGVITATASPGVISTGTVTPSGELAGSGLFAEHQNCVGGVLTVAYAGKISTNAAGTATAAGTFTDPSKSPPNCQASSGPWIATRTR